MPNPDGCISHQRPHCLRAFLSSYPTSNNIHSLTLSRSLASNFPRCQIFPTSPLSVRPPMEEIVHEDRPDAEGNGSAPTKSAYTTWNSKSTPARRHKRRPRQPISCAPCRHSKLKCDRQQPCASCRRRSCIDTCTYRGTQRNTLRNTPNSTVNDAVPRSFPAKQGSLQTLLPDSSTQSLQESIPSLVQPSTTPEEQQQQDTTHLQWDALLQRPIDQMGQSELSPDDPFTHSGSFCFPFPLGPNISQEELLALLPPPHCCEYLVTEYFMRLSPLFHILHGPTFQKQYNTFRNSPSQVDLSWLALLFAVCSATMNTMEPDNGMLGEILDSIPGPHNVSTLAYHYRTAAMICLSQDHFLIRHSLSTLESLLLLIYTISNNEGAERAWTLLGKQLSSPSRANY